MSLTVKLALGSIFIGLVVLVLKYLAYWVTGSIALYWCFVLIRFGHRERSPALVAWRTASADRCFYLCRSSYRGRCSRLYRMGYPRSTDRGIGSAQHPVDGLRGS